jgi:hypothetical protein
MQRNGALLSQEDADHMRQVRAEIGRGLRERYDAGKWPMSDRLADLVRKIQHPDERWVEGRPTSKPVEYRANAQECERVAAISRNPNEKATWLQIARQWLGMIPKVELIKSDQLDAAGHTSTRPKSE